MVVEEIDLEAIIMRWYSGHGSEVENLRTVCRQEEVERAQDRTLEKLTTQGTVEEK